MPMLAAPLDRENPDKERLRRIGNKVRRRLAENKAVKKLAVDKAEMWAMANFLDSVECGRLGAIIDAAAQPSKAYDVEYSRGIRTSFSADVDPGDAFIRKLEARFDDLLGIDPTFGETIQGQRYTVGQEFKPHADWFSPGTVPWSLERNRGGQRTFTAMVYLNDVEEGGETDFPYLDIAIEPRPGTLLIWNNADENGVPNPWTMHAGNPVTRGYKYIITKWYRCQLRRPFNPPGPAPR